MSWKKGLKYLIFTILLLKMNSSFCQNLGKTFTESIHKFYHNDSLLLELDDASFYDNASAYIWCANQLFDINAKIYFGSEIKIISHNNEIVNISKCSNFEEWVKNKFNSKFNKGFENYIFVRLLNAPEDAKNYKLIQIPN